MKKILRGQRREESERFIGFRSHWDLKASFVIRREATKKVAEKRNKAIFRRHYLMSLPEPCDLEQLNRRLRESSRKKSSASSQAVASPIGAGMAVEREHLQPVTEEGFDLAAVSFPMVNGSGTVNALTNFYSTPLALVTKVEAKASAAYVEIWRGRPLCGPP